MSAAHRHFEVDKAGLAKILSRRGIEFAVLELLQNALDENVTTVSVSIEPHGVRGYHRIVINDDNPTGFADLSHAYTLFAESAKKSNPTKRGRFNLGEKLVIAAAKETTISTTTGTIRFTADGRHHSKACTERGTAISVVMKMTQDEAARSLVALRSCIVPSHVLVVVNGQPLPCHVPMATFEVTLPTEVADDEGYLRPTRRLTSVSVYPVRPGETAALFELGIPVVETGDGYHVDIGQKVPLSTDRDNVTPAYLHRVRAEVLNVMHDSMTAAEAGKTWVQDALQGEHVAPEAVRAVITAQYGDKVVVRDPSDPESNKLAMAKGYAIIEPGAFGKSAWSNIRSSGAAKPAGQVTPGPSVVFSSGGKDVTVPEEKWTQAQVNMVAYVTELAKALLGAARVHVDIVNDPRGYSACWGAYEMLLNVRCLGHAWFDKPDWDKVNALVLHEVAHHFAMDHLSSGYHEALCKLGVKLARLAVERPGLVRR